MNTGKFTAEKLTFTLFEGAGMLDLRLLALGTEAPDYLAGRSGFVGPGGWVDEPDETRGDDWCLIEGGARVLQGVSFTQRAPANLVAVCAAWKARPAPASKQDVAVVRAVLNEAGRADGDWRAAAAAAASRRSASSFSCRPMARSLASRLSAAAWASAKRAAASRAASLRAAS